MKRPAKLSDEEIVEALSSRDSWTLVDGKLFREFLFKDFNEAFGFMTRCALIAGSTRRLSLRFRTELTVRG